PISRAPLDRRRLAGDDRNVAGVDARVLGHETLEPYAHGTGILASGRALELREPVLELLPRRRPAVQQDPQPPMVGLADALARRTELLRELLTGAQAGEADVDVLVGSVAREPDHVDREIEHAHGLTHVEEEDLAAPAADAGMEDEMDRLRNQHEV